MREGFAGEPVGVRRLDAALATQVTDRLDSFCKDKNVRRSLSQIR